MWTAGPPGIHQDHFTGLSGGNPVSFWDSKRILRHEGGEKVMTELLVPMALEPAVLGNWLPKDSRYQGSVKKETGETD